MAHSRRIKAKFRITAATLMGVATFWGFTRAHAQQAQDTSISKECNSAQFDEALAKVDPTLGSFNFQCNQKKLLVEANNLVILVSIYNKFKHSIVATEILNGKPKGDLIKNLPENALLREDNTCLEKRNLVSKPGGVQPGSGDDETVESCIARLHRIMTDSEISAREIVLQNNKQIEDMVASEDKIAAGSVTTDAAKGSTLKDIYRAGQSDKGFSQFTAGQVPEKGSAKHIGDVTLRAADEGLAKAETKDIKAINSSVSLDADSGNSRLEVASTDDQNRVVSNASVSSGLKPLKAKAKAAFQHDQLDIESAIDAERTKRIAAAKLKPSTNPKTVSFRAFQQVKQAIDGGVNKNKKGGSAPSAPARDLTDAELEKKGSIKRPISDKAVGEDKTSGTLDDTIKSDINDLKNSL